LTDVFRVLAIGDVVGKAGRSALQEILPEFRKKRLIDFCVINGENSAGGSGLTETLVEEILKAGADVITSGDHIFKRKEIIARLDTDPRVLRPANMPGRAAGRGFGLFAIGDVMVGVVNLLGRTFMPPITNCPFDAAELAVSELRKHTRIIIVDFHAEATSEKVAMGWYLDGRVSLVFGTHTHIQTADERILPAGTAYITDVGMTGPYDSVIGRKKEKILAHLLTGMPTPFDVANGDLRLCGAIVEIDKHTGGALTIERVQERLK
jgi:metallophosphoesterase (TIGR00282 family)